MHTQINLSTHTHTHTPTSLLEWPYCTAPPIHTSTPQELAPGNPSALTAPHSPVWTAASCCEPTPCVAVHDTGTHQKTALRALSCVAWVTTKAAPCLAMVTLTQNMHFTTPLQIVHCWNHTMHFALEPRYSESASSAFYLGITDHCKVFNSCMACLQYVTTPVDL